MAAKRVIKNAVCNLLGRNWQLLLSLIAIPFIIKYIGVRRYGLWAILNILTTYFGLLDFGIGSGFIKYIAEFHSKKDYASINKVVSTGLFVYLFFAIILMFALLSATSLVIGFFKIPVEMYDEAVFVIRIGILIYCLSAVLLVFRAVIDGLQRMEISNAVGIIGSILRFAGIFIILKLGCGLRGLMLNNLAVFLVSMVLVIYSALRLLPEIKISFHFVKFATFKKLFTFGINLQVSRLSSFANFQMDKFVLAHFLGLGSVTYYQLGAKVAETMRCALYPLLTAITPAASQLHACDENEKVYVLFSKASKYMVLALVPVMCLSIFNAGLIMRFWMGSDYQRSAFVMQILVLGYFMNMSCGVVSPIVQGIGRPQIQMRAAFLSAALNICLSIILVVKMGFYGAALGTAVSLILANLYYVYSFHKFMDKSLLSYFLSNYTLPLLSGVLSSSVVIFISRFVIFSGSESISRFHCFLVLVLFSTVFILLYFVLIYFTGFFDDYDRKLICSYLPLRKAFFNKSFTKMKKGIL